MRPGVAEVDGQAARIAAFDPRLQGMIFRRAPIGAVIDIRHERIDGEQGTARTLGARARERLVRVDLVVNVDGLRTDVGDVEQQVSQKLALDAKTPLHALGGLQVEVPGGRTAAGKCGDIADVGPPAPESPAAEGTPGLPPGPR